MSFIQWISVKDRLPERGGYYTVTVKCAGHQNEVSNHIYFDKDSGKWGFDSDDLFSDRVEVIAWMPPLAPYREE